MKGKIRVVVPVVIEPDDGGFHAYVPHLPGCHVGGETLEEAKRNILDAAYLYVKALIERGEPLPVGVAIEVEKPKGEERPPDHTDPLFPDMPREGVGAPICERADLLIPVPA